jgi:RecA-family ATPase
LPLHHVPRSSAGDSATQSSALGDSFATVINDVICSLEDDPTQKELHAETSQAKKRPTAIALENVSSSIAQQNVST